MNAVSIGGNGNRSTEDNHISLRFIFCLGGLHAVIAGGNGDRTVIHGQAVLAFHAIVGCIHGNGTARQAQMLIADNAIPIGSLYRQASSSVNGQRICCINTGSFCLCVGAFCFICI